MVFYFTATGNSLYVAKALDENVISIPKILNIPKITSNNLEFTDNKIGIVCPIYGHEMPQIVKEFIAKANFNTNYFYVILTYGNLHGGSAKLAKKYIDSCCKRANYINTILMVDNFLPLFDMDKQLVMKKKVDEQIAQIKIDVRLNKNHIQRASIRDKFVHKGYLAYAKGKELADIINYQVNDDCVGCGICSQVCPVGCINVTNSKPVFTLNNCQACMACIHSCPQKAIKIATGEVNPNARYRNENIELNEIIKANNIKN